MARPRKGRAKRNRGCQLCKPHRKAGNGGVKATNVRRDPLTGIRHIGHRVHPADYDGSSDWDES